MSTRPLTTLRQGCLPTRIVTQAPARARRAEEREALGPLTYLRLYCTEAQASGEIGFSLFGTVVRKSLMLRISECSRCALANALW